MEFAYVVHPVVGRAHASHAGAHPDQHRSPDNALEELVGLTAAIDLDVGGAEILNVPKPKSGTLFGSGQIENLIEALDDLPERPIVLVVDGQLTPVQHRNLEEAIKIKVLDRTALILEIFGARARTREGRLQVELAHLTYQKSRLVRSWTHLERQRGGAGFLGGPGERQIESDRRILSEKIVRLKKKLDEVRRTRTLQRAKRKRAPQPMIALVGYTNAGKSTLFNYLTRADVRAQDLLFATLDPTMRAVTLPSGQDVIFSDTVGFISDLPTSLVASFRATLEEVLEADIVVHVRDVAHPDSLAQRNDVIDVLRDLGAIGEDDEDYAVDGKPARVFVEALNKVDLLDDEDRLAIEATARLSLETAAGTADEPVKIAVSALRGEGLEGLFEIVDQFLTADRSVYQATLALEDGAARAFLHSCGDVIEETSDDHSVQMMVRLTAKSAGQFRSQMRGTLIDVNAEDLEFSEEKSVPYRP